MSFVPAINAVAFLPLLAVPFRFARPPPAEHIETPRQRNHLT